MTSVRMSLVGLFALNILQLPTVDVCYNIPAEGKKTTTQGAEAPWVVVNLTIRTPLRRASNLEPPRYSYRQNH